MDLNSTAVYAEWLGNDSIIVTDNVMNRLILRITNITREAITVEASDNIKLYFPVGNEYYHFTTAKRVKDIVCTPPYNWNCKFDEISYTWSISPKKTFKIQVEESIVIVFTNIISDKDCLNVSMSCVNMYLNHSGIEDSPIQIPVFMNVASAKINKFTCSNSTVGILDEVTFNWETMGANSVSSSDLVNSGKNGIFLLPNFGPNLNPKFKSQDMVKCTVMETTNYALLVSNNKESVTENCDVYVMEPNITEFKFIRNQNMVTLKFTLENTCHCYINCGVGRINCTPDYSKGYCISKGEVTVPINKYVGIYELSCLGQNGLVSKVLKVPKE